MKAFFPFKLLAINHYSFRLIVSFSALNFYIETHCKKILYFLYDLTTFIPSMLFAIETLNKPKTILSFKKPFQCRRRVVTLWNTFLKAIVKPFLWSGKSLVVNKLYFVTAWIESILCIRIEKRTSWIYKRKWFSFHYLVCWKQRAALEVVSC